MTTIGSKSLGCFQEHPNTLQEYDNEVSYQRISKVISAISASQCLKRGDKTCFVVGMGKHPKSTYTDLEGEPGLEVIWFDTILPRYARFFSGLIASYAGLVKITDTAKLPNTFLKLFHLSMAGIYCFAPVYETAFIDAVIKDPNHKNFDYNIVKSDAGYLIYVVDADNSESSTGIYEIVSYGLNTPESLRILPSSKKSLA